MILAVAVDTHTVTLFFGVLRLAINTRNHTHSHMVSMLYLEHTLNWVYLDMKGYEGDNICETFCTPYTDF